MKKTIFKSVSSLQVSWIAALFFVLPASLLAIHKPDWVFHVLGINYLFLIMAVFLCLSKMGNIHFHGDQDTMLPTYSLTKWFGLIVTIEIFASVLFINILQTGLYYLPTMKYTTFILPDPNVILNHLFLDWGLFPWSLYGILACMLAFFYFHENQPGLFSAILPPLKSTYRDRFIRRGINLFSNIVTNIAFTIMLMMIILQFGIIILHHYQVDNTLNIRLGAAVIYMFLGVLILSPALGLFIHHIGRRAKRLWVYLIPFIIFTLIALITCTLVGNFLYPYLQGPLERSGALLQKFKIARGDWQLLYWSWWVICAPLTSSLIARISKGRTLRELLLGTLLLPTIIAYLLVVKNADPSGTTALALDSIGHTLFWMGNNHYFSLLTGLIILGFFMQIKDSRYSMFGFMPYKKSYVTAQPVKTTEFVPPLLQFTMLFIAAFLYSNLRSIQYLATVAAIPSMLFFILCSLLFYRWLFSVKAK